MTSPVSPEFQLKKYLPEKYTETFPLSHRITGVVVFALVAVVITAYVLLLSGHLVTLPHDFIHLFAHVNPISLGIGLGVTTLVVSGVAFVIYRARKAKDPLIESHIFQYSNISDYLEEAVIQKPEPKKFELPAYIDTSTLDTNGDGKAYIYAVKDCANHYTVSTIVTLLSPAYIVSTVAYHALRMCVVPFYLLVRLVIERCFTDEHRYKLIDVVKEPFISLHHIVKAPFYGLAFFSAGIYSLFNPMGGRILGSKIERDWNNGVSRAEGFWSVICEAGGGPQPLFDWEYKLDMNFFLAGCWQPMGVVTFKNHEIVEGVSLTKAVNNKKGHNYNVFLRSFLESET